jgi:hypothetical protein
MSWVKDLEKMMDMDNPTRTQQDSPAMMDLLNKSRNRIFYCWNWKDNAMSKLKPCCWTHLVGLPKKGNKEYPLFDYEGHVHSLNQHIRTLDQLLTMIEDGMKNNWS